MSSGEDTIRGPKLIPADLIPADRIDPQILLALNKANETETAPLDLAGLRDLLAASWRSIAAGRGEAVVIAMNQSSPYASPNFRWFKARHDRFAYVDRIIVSEAARGRGLARFLYEHVFDLARAEGLMRIGCEVNLIPPNPISDAFHARLGFEEVGRAELPDATKAGGTKTVRYMERRLD